MVYAVMAGVTALLGLVLLWLSVKTLADKGWLAGFLRGCIGLVLLLLTGVFFLVAEDLASYRVAENERAVLTLSFKSQGPQRFAVQLQQAGDKQLEAVIEGEQWQLDVQMLRWSPLMNAMGFHTGYRLHELRGRYLALGLDRQKTPDAYPLSQSRHLDVWQLLNNYAAHIAVLKAPLVSPGFIPIADGAMFEVVSSGTALVARPLNNEAKAAMASW